jgi:hypothetical protein
LAGAAAAAANARVMLLDIHGLIVACQTPFGDLAADLVRPFRYFLVTTGKPAVVVTVESIDPPYAAFPRLPAAFSTPRNVVYAGDGVRIVDYFGRGAVVQDGGGYRIYGTDRNLVREIFYLLVLSLLGQYCDRAGMLRVHALAVSRNDRAFLFTMPPGSGKSTLALALLRTGHVRYISDDDPLFDRQGRILTFPRALGLLDRSSLEGIPDTSIFRVDRMEFGTKYFVDVSEWADRIESRPLTDIVVVAARRVLNGEPRVEPMSRLRLFRTLWRDAVIGIGLYQGLEFLVTRPVRELAAKAPVLVRRLRLAAMLARRSRSYELVITRDQDATLRVVTAFIEGAS